MFACFYQHRYKQVELPPCVCRSVSHRRKKRFVVVIFIFAGSGFLKIHLVHQREEFKIKVWNQRYCFKILCWFHFEFWNRVLWMIVQNNINCRVPRILWCSARAVRTHFTREKYHSNFSRPTVKRDGVSRILSRNNETHETLCFFLFCFFPPFISIWNQRIISIFVFDLPYILNKIRFGKTGFFKSGRSVGRLNSHAGKYTTDLRRSTA